MNKKEFVDLFYSKGDFVSKVEAEKKVTAFIETLTEVLLEGKDISFIGFGKFEVVTRAPRTCRNLQTGENMQIPAKKGIKFKPGKLLAENLNK